MAATTVMAAAVGTFSSVSRADCAAPIVKTVRSASPGDTIEVRGQYWGSECNDTPSGVGCSPRPLGPAQTNLRISLAYKTGPGTWQYGMLVDGIDADPESYRVQVAVTVPENMPPGRYRIAMGNVDIGTYRSEVLVIE